MSTRERPILMSAPMVRALLAGTKTQTRRALKHQPLEILPMKKDLAGVQWVTLESREPKPHGRIVACRFGQPGDRLWVRERWAPRDGLTLINQQRAEVFYWADDEGKHWSDGPWKPSIHMPRWASRIKLELTGVRVERLQDISEADAIAEGVHADPRCRQDDDTPGFHRIGPVRDGSFPIARYGALWESLNGPGSWKANPWVWVLEFRRI